MTAHDPDRRATLVRALVEIVADRGLDAVSVREVAAHANVSIGAVQHHFRTKSAMLRAAMDDVARRWAEDVEKDTESAEPDTALRHLLHKLVPTTPTDEDARVWLAFVARAAVDPDLATVHSEGMARLEEALVRGALTHGVAPGPPPADCRRAGSSHGPGGRPHRSGPPGTETHDTRPRPRDRRRARRPPARRLRPG